MADYLRGGIRRLKTFIADSIAPTPNGSKGRRDHCRQNQQPAIGLSRQFLRQLHGVRPDLDPFAVGKNAGGSSGGGAAIAGDGMLPLAEGTTAAARSGSSPPGAVSMDTRRRSGAFPASRVRTRSPAPPHSCSRAISHKNRGDAAIAVTALPYNLAHPLAERTGGFSTRDLATSIRGWLYVI